MGVGEGAESWPLNAYRCVRNGLDLEIHSPAVRDILRPPIHGPVLCCTSQMPAEGQLAGCCSTTRLAL